LYREKIREKKIRPDNAKEIVCPWIRKSKRSRKVKDNFLFFNSRGVKIMGKIAYLLVLNKYKAGAKIEKNRIPVSKGLCNLTSRL
jgi:hypothetical protein